MNWAISNLTGGNRVSRAILVRYSTVPLAENVDTASQTASSTSSSTSFSSAFAVPFLHAARHVPGRAVPRHPPAQIALPLDVEETVTCFCRKARRKDRDGDQNSTDTKLYLEESVLERKLPEADLKALVDLPAGLDYNEWLASHTLALFEHVNLVYGTISEFCTPSGCADMTGPGNRTYLWFDEKGKKTRVAAPQYIDYVMTFTQKTVSDESIFPTKYANEFPSSFESIARKILRLQFHVIAHLYAAHFREIALLGLHTHLNLTFAHLTALHRRFNLIDEKETDVLRDLEVALRLTDDSQQQQQQQQHQQHQHNLDAGDIGYALHNNTTTQTQQTCKGGDDVNLQQQQQQHQIAAAASTGAPLIDGDSAAPPICTQPEAVPKVGAAAVFAGGGNLMGGILGDLTSGEFGDTTGYCTSAVPSSCSINNSQAAATADAVASSLQSSFNNNNHAQHTLHHHYHHPHPHTHAHAHHLLQQQQHQQNSGLIQCNVSSAPSNSTTTTTTTA